METFFSYLVPAKRCKNEAILTFNAVWKLFFSILILSCPTLHHHLGQLCFIQLLKNNNLLKHMFDLLSSISFTFTNSLTVEAFDSQHKKALTSLPLEMKRRKSPHGHLSNTREVFCYLLTPEEL